jgi:ABC-type nitrate/sulfonate/bicarbonate transport system permease component
MKKLDVNQMEKTQGGFIGFFIGFLIGIIIAVIVTPNNPYSTN